MTRKSFDDNALMDEINFQLKEVRSSVERIEEVADSNHEDAMHFAFGKILGISRNALVSLGFLEEHLKLLTLRMEESNESQ